MVENSPCTKNNVPSNLCFIADSMAGLILIGRGTATKLRMGLRAILNLKAKLSAGTKSLARIWAVCLKSLVAPNCSNGGTMYALLQTNTTSPRSKARMRHHMKYVVFYVISSTRLPLHYFLRLDYSYFPIYFLLTSTYCCSFVAPHWFFWEIGGDDRSLYCPLVQRGSVR